MLTARAAPVGLLRGSLARPATTFGFRAGRVNLIGEHTDYNDGLVQADGDFRSEPPKLSRQRWPGHGLQR